MIGIFLISDFTDKVCISLLIRLDILFVIYLKAFSWSKEVGWEFSFLFNCGMINLGNVHTQLKAMGVWTTIDKFETVNSLYFILVVTPQFGNL